MNAKHSDLPGSTTTFDESGNEINDVDATPSSRTMISVKTNRRGALVHDENPFLFTALRDMRTRKKLLTVQRGTEMVRNEAGEIKTLYTNAQVEKELDRATFVKVFSGPDFKDVYNLTMPGLKMYLVVLDILGDVSSMNKVHIRLTTAMAMNLTAKSDCPLSETTINRGVKDLIDKNYLAAAEINGEKDGWYWIHPQRFFNGDTVVIKQIYKIARENKTSKLQVELPAIDVGFNTPKGQDNE